MGRFSSLVSIGIFATTLGGISWALGDTIDPQVLCICGAIFFLIGMISEVMS